MTAKHEIREAQMILSVQGNHAYCYTGGKPLRPGLPAAVFIHGAQNDHSVWVLQTRYFAHHGFNVLAPDLPAHGRSKGAALTTVEAMADWLLAVLDAAGVAQAHLIGHSMGSLIALEAAARAPQRAASLALVATAYPMKVSDALLEAAQNDEPRAIDMVNIWSHSSIAQKPSWPGPGSYVMNGGLRLKQRIARLGPKLLFHTDFSACNAYANGLQAAQSVKCPVLFLLGRRDMMTAAKAASALASALPQARRVLVEDCGHELMAEQPDRVLDELFRFAGGN
jgi:pimeloyl-ACP methyl ester carboxylesterase